MEEKMTIAEAIAAAQFPVYGIVDRPLDLTFDGVFTIGGRRPSISLSFTSQRYPSYPSKMLALRNFRIDSQHALNVTSPPRDVILEKVIQEQAQPVRNPFLWEGSLSIAGTLFHGKMRYYATPLKLSEYHLLSEESFVSGYANGPSCDELIELLEGLQVLNGRDEVIKQYYS
jgi:hypothetical protein